MTVVWPSRKVPLAPTHNQLSSSIFKKIRDIMSSRGLYDILEGAFLLDNEAEPAQYVFAMARLGGDALGGGQLYVRASQLHTVEPRTKFIRFEVIAYPMGLGVITRSYTPYEAAGVLISLTEVVEEAVGSPG